MKLFRVRYFSIIALAVVALAGCAGLQPARISGNADSAAAARRIIAAYNVSGLLAQADSVLTQSLMQRLPATVDAAKRQRIRRIIDNAFRAGKLTQAVRERLQQQARQAGRGRVLATAAAKLESPLAKRMLQLQSKAGEDGFASGYNEFLRQPRDARRERRLQQLRTLMQAKRIIDVQSAFQLTLLQTMVATRNALTPASRDIDQAMLEQLLDSTRKTLHTQMQEQVPLLLLYVYRDIDDATLKAYVELQSSPAVSWTNQALVTAIQGALESAGEQVSTRVGELS